MITPLSTSEFQAIYPRVYSIVIMIETSNGPAKYLEEKKNYRKRYFQRSQMGFGPMYFLL